MHAHNTNAPPYEEPLKNPQVEVQPLKLGGGPQRHKYTIEELLTVYVGLSEQNSLRPQFLKLTEYAKELPASETGANVLKMLSAIAQSMVSGKFKILSESLDNTSPHTSGSYI